MLGATSVYDSNKHTRMGGEIGEFVKRLAERSGRDLGLIRYEELGVFCIIEYLSPRHDVFVDTMNLGGSLANFDRVKRMELEKRLFRPLTCEETSRAISAGESDYHHFRMEDQAEETERLDRIGMGE